MSEPREKPSVLMAFPSIGPYHFARLLALQTELASHNLRLVPVALYGDDGVYAWDLQAGGQLPIVTLLKRRQDGFAASVRYCIRLAQLIATERPTAVFVPSYSPWRNLLVGLLAKAAGARIILMTDSWSGTARPGWHVRFLKRTLISLFDAALVAGSLHRRTLLDFGMPGENILPGYDVVDNAGFAECVGQRATAAAPCPPLLLSIARFIPKKNLSRLISAYALACRREPTLPTLVLAGGGALLPTLVEHAQREGLAAECPPDFASANLEGAARVILFNFVSQAEVKQLYVHAIGLILASTHEEWGLVVNEALAAGLPVLVSSRVGCHPELVADGQNGFLIDPDSVEDISSKILRLHALWREGQPWARMSACSQEIVRPWTPERFARAATALLSDSSPSTSSGSPDQP